MSALVTAATCPHCGGPVTVGGAFCPSCGSPLPPASAPAGASSPFPTSVGPPLASPNPYPPGFGGVPDPKSRETDRRALSNVTVGAVISLVSAVVSIATLFLRSTAPLDIATGGSTGTSITFPLAALYLLAVTGAVGFVFGLLELWFYRSAFRDLSQVDARFSTPSKLTLLAIVSLVLIAAVGAGLVVLVYQAIQCAGAGNPITTSCVSLRAVGGLILLLGLFAILALVGWIGFLLGVWRLGSRYHESLFKAGAILLIFPVLNLIGVILILVGARNARAQLQTPTGMPSFG